MHRDHIVVVGESCEVPAAAPNLRCCVEAWVGHPFGVKMQNAKVEWPVGGGIVWGPTSTAPLVLSCLDLSRLVVSFSAEPTAGLRRNQPQPLLLFLQVIHIPHLFM